jgi:hypothetical protein
MLEYFTYKKVKKHQAEKHAKEGSQTPVINEEDEHFLTRVISAEGTPPPLPVRPQLGAEAGDSTNNKAQMVVHGGDATSEPAHDGPKTQDKGKGKETEKPTQKDAKKISRLSLLARTISKRVRSIGPEPLDSS